MPIDFTSREIRPIQGPDIAAVSRMPRFRYREVVKAVECNGWLGYVATKGSRAAVRAAIVIRDTPEPYPRITLLTAFPGHEVAYAALMAAASETIELPWLLSYPEDLLLDHYPHLSDLPDLSISRAQENEWTIRFRPGVAAALDKLGVDREEGGALAPGGRDPGGPGPGSLSDLRHAPHGL